MIKQDKVNWLMNAPFSNKKYLEDMIWGKKNFILGNSTFYRGLWHLIYRNNPKTVLLGWFNHDLQSFVSLTVSVTKYEC